MSLIASEAYQAIYLPLLLINIGLFILITEDILKKDQINEPTPVNMKQSVVLVIDTNRVQNAKFANHKIEPSRVRYMVFTKKY